MFGKHFQSMYTGSMYGKGSHVFAVWGYCISHAHYDDHSVELNPAMLANMIGESEERIEEAIRVLCSEDAKSRSKEHNGKRLIHEGGFLYFLVNHEKYRNIRSDDERKEYNRIKKREERAKSNHMSLTVNDKSNSPSVSVSVSGSGILEGVQGETCPGQSVTVRDGFLGLYDKIRTCRREYANMREMDVVTLLNGNKDMEAVTRMVDEWCMEQANAPEPMANPIASLRKRITAIGDNPYAAWIGKGKK